MVLTFFVFGNAKVVVNLLKIYPKDTEAPAGGVDDMTKLSYLHEPGVLQNLKSRYELNEIYVCFSYLSQTGQSLLIILIEKSYCIYDLCNKICCKC